MNEPMKKYMKPGLIHFMAYPTTMRGDSDDIVETVRKVVVDSYFDAIEVAWVKDKAARQQVIDMLDRSYMTVAYGGSPRLLTTGMNINDLDEDKRKAAVATMKEGIDDAYDYGAVGFSFLSGKYEEATKEESYQQLIKSTKEMCAYAKSKGDLTIVLEVFDYDVDKKSLIGPVALAKRYAEEICAECDNFGLLVDLSHLPILRETPKQSILPVKDYIKHIHIGNAVIKEGEPAYGDEHPRFGFPNSENDVDELVEFLEVLLDIGYLDGKEPKIVSFEVKPYKDEDPDIVVANAKRVLDAAWARIER